MLLPAGWGHRSLPGMPTLSTCRFLLPRKGCPLGHAHFPRVPGGDLCHLCHPLSMAGHPLLSGKFPYTPWVPQSLEA